MLALILVAQVSPLDPPLPVYVRSPIGLVVTFRAQEVETVGARSPEVLYEAFLRLVISPEAWLRTAPAPSTPPAELRRQRRCDRIFAAPMRFELEREARLGALSCGGEP
ncbi:MAG: hypothetical protein HY791_18385 [Deltaproteobacteria bacterium]|nr:hypothetical protein [Deltaproteobacteria bacterium]